MTAWVLALLTLASADSGTGETRERCVVIEISAVGRSAHGATVNLHAAPHRLIRALDRLPGWLATAPGIHSARIARLAAAPAVNIIPARASAQIEVRFTPDRDASQVADDLAKALRPEIQVQPSVESCAPEPPAGDRL